MSGWGSGFPGVMADNTQKKAAAANAPAQATEQSDKDETEEPGSAQ